MLVDGSSYLYRAFHALPDLRTRRGEPTGALRGVVSMLRRLVEDGKPDYFAVVFDAPGKTFRDEWYPQYKANRAAMPDELGQQIAPLHEMVRAHGWPLLMIAGVEADDVIGTLAAQAAEAGIDTVISSSDKDLTQLVRPGIKMVNTMSNETYDEAGVLAKFDVRPDQVLDLLTLTGDAIDNIPGVAKVGPKTAAKWLAQYGTLDNIIAKADEIGGVVGANLREALAWLPQGKRLLTVKTDCELPLRVTDLSIAPAGRGRDQGALRAVRVQAVAQGRRAAERTSAVKLRSAPRATTRAGASTPRPSRRRSSRPPPPAEIHYEIVQDEAALARWLDLIDGAEVTAFDTETSSLDNMRVAHHRRLARRGAGPRVLYPARSSLHRRSGTARSRRNARAASRRGSPMRRRGSSATT